MPNLYSQYRQDISQAYQRISSRGKMIETAGGPMQYTEFGEGPPMLIVHGAGGGYDQGEYFAKFIGGKYRWIAPSRFGFLGTPVPEDANSSLQADAYASLLVSLGIDRVGVVGVSMGGPSSLSFALQYPHRTTSLVLISAAILALIFNLFLNDFVFWSLVRLRPRELLVAPGVPAQVQKQLRLEEVAQLHAFLESIIPMGARRKGQKLEQHMSEYDAEQIKKIRAPTLILHAPDDTLVALEHGEFSARNIPGAQFILMDKGGHLAVMLKRNSAAKENVLKFLDQYNNPDLTEMPSIEIKGDIVCGK